MAARAGPCQFAGDLAYCDAIALTPGGTVTLTMTASSLAALKPLRLVAVARSCEPEGNVANTLARATVRMRRPPLAPCAADTSARPPVAYPAC